MIPVRCATPVREGGVPVINRRRPDDADVRSSSGSGVRVAVNPVRFFAKGLYRGLK
jgi:hypothetical protein